MDSLIKKYLNTFSINIYIRIQIPSFKKIPTLFFIFVWLIVEKGTNYIFYVFVEKSWKLQYRTLYCHHNNSEQFVKYLSSITKFNIFIIIIIDHNVSGEKIFNYPILKNF